MKKAISTVCVALAACLALPAFAAEARYPVKPLRLVDPFPPGGPSDIVGRAIAPRLSEALGQTVVVDNRAGAAGIVGSDFVAKSPPDGYTLLIGPSGALTIQPTLNPKLPFDPQRDFEPVTQLTSGPQLIAVHPSLPVKTVKELIAFAKARPGQLNYASGGAGTANHIAVEGFKLAAGIDVVHVPYKGTGPALTSVVSGESQMTILSLLALLPHVQSGRLKALGVTSAARSSTLPNVPTAAESGLPAFETSSWHGILAPAKTPREIVTRLHAELVKALNAPDVRDRLTAQGLNVIGSTPAEFGAYIKSETSKYARVIRQIGLKLDQ